ncbi:TPA: hypothetical protein L3526_004410 [Escherichia coli]|nr:hypothetical protein [Escherichia coli]
MSSLGNITMNDGVDELTAMLQLLDEPVKNASRSENTDDIDHLLVDLDVGVDIDLDEALNEVQTIDFSQTLNDLESLHEPVEIINTKCDSVAENSHEQAECMSDEEHVENKNKEQGKLLNDSLADKRKRSARASGFYLNDKDETFFKNAGLEKDAFLNACENAPVKAKEKILNLLNWFNGGCNISVYTAIAIRHLISENKATSNSMKIAFMSNPLKPYPITTASSQAGQMMSVLSISGVAKREGDTLTLNKESPLVKLFSRKYAEHPTEVA